MQALFLYVGHYGCSRADQMIYLGILPEGGDPIDLIKSRYDFRPPDAASEWDRFPKLVDKTTGAELTMFPPKYDGETSYGLLDLDKPGEFMSCFEHEGGYGLLGNLVQLKPDDWS